MRYNTVKRILSVLAITLLLFTGCSDQKTPAIKVNENSVTRAGLTYTFSVSEEYIWMEDSAFTLQRLADGEWVDVTPIAPMIFSTEHLFVRSGEARNIDWSGFYGALENGTYRLLKKCERYSGQLDANGLPSSDFDRSAKAEFTCYGKFEITAQTPSK